MVHHVVAVEYGVLSSFWNTFLAQCEQVAQCADNNQEVAVEGLDCADRLRVVVLQMVTTCVLGEGWNRQERFEEIFAADCTGTRTAASVRGGEGLVQVQMNNIKAGIAWTNDAHDGV